MELKDKKLSEIAQIVREDYLDAMATLDSIKDKYFFDDGDDIVIYFLSNAQSWHGDTARTVKKELNRRFQENR